MPQSAEFDIIVHGATGFTGRLVAEHLARVADERAIKFALSGRNLGKLEAIQKELSLPAKVALIEADSEDRPSMDRLVARTRAVLTTAGPFQLNGESLVAACAETGADYLDLSGEVAWMRSMIDRYEMAARSSGARILFSSGFDSIPSELGILYLQHVARQRFGVPVTRVHGRVTSFKGGFSGGTVAAGAATRAAAEKDPAVNSMLANPFALTPGFTGPLQPGEEDEPTFDEVLQQWTAPFVMASINTRNVHRSNLLQNHAYGKNFRYDERVSVGPADGGRERAEQIMRATNQEGGNLPEPGEGPSKDEREAGFYDLLFVGITDDGRRVDVTVHGDRDPGYGSTSKIVSETAIFLEQQGASTAGGVWTPGAALGLPLVDWLTEHAGLTFHVEE